MTTLLDAARQALEALEANHQWHQDYDEHNGYPGSELAATNVAALTKARTAIAEAEKAEPKVEPLFTHPPKHEPLTDEQIDAAHKTEKLAILALMHHDISAGNFTRALRLLARAVERAHGIGDSNG
jgi:hypothetical protein